MLLQDRNKAKGKWEYFKSVNEVETVRKARDMGWAENKVQVRVHQTGINDFLYAIEPYEDCGCSNLLKYDDYFTPPMEDELTLT